MNRRGFFAAILAPLVVPFKPPFDVKLWCQGYDVVYGLLPRRRRPTGYLQRHMNALYNQRIDNITLSLR